MENERDSGGPALGTALQPAVRRIVTDALARGAGATLPTNAEYLAAHGFGAGTIQRALNLLRERGALTITSHGHRGRSVGAIDVGQAWQAAGLAPVRLLLPPSGPAEIDVLEQAMAEGLTDLGIPHTVHHRGGGAGRLRSVTGGEHDVALVSGGVGLPVRVVGPARVLGPGTYYAPGRLVVVRRAAALDRTPVRIAIDSGSPDHVALTRAEFPPDSGVTYRETPFPSVPAAVLRDEVDAGIWHIQRSVIPLDLAGLATRQPRSAASLTAWQHLSSAVLVGWSGRPELTAVLGALPLDDVAPAQLAAVAAEEAAGERDS
ncbi:YhfZ family protein [Streptomyces sp. MS19]|uniref:YhfZ family protein n=1 Tax=Streptomyces sp. MS19 TaxID=3385972 RepID=UPI00399EF014